MRPNEIHALSAIHGPHFFRPTYNALSSKKKLLFVPKIYSYKGRRNNDDKTSVLYACNLWCLEAAVLENPIAGSVMEVGKPFSAYRLHSSTVINLAVNMR